MKVHWQRKQIESHDSALAKKKQTKVMKVHLQRKQTERHESALAKKANRKS